MKKNNIIAVLLLLCSASALINAYENSFFNNTEVPIGIAIQYTGNDSIKEPLYKQLIKPGSLMTFSPGKSTSTTTYSSHKVEIPAIKWGFCLDNIYYVENPTQEQKKYNFKEAIWKKIPITWVEEKSITERKETKRPRKPITVTSTKPKAEYPLRRERPIPSAEKSLCRDRHFDIIRNEYGKITITSSLYE
jgi:hypothetical protein